MTKAASNPIVTVSARAIAEIGASLLHEAIRVMEANGISRDLVPAAFAVANAGCVKMAKMTDQEMLSGIKAAMGFWSDEEDQVVFLPEGNKGTGQEEAADDCESN